MNELEQKLKLAISRSERIKTARDEAERLLEQKSRELYEANSELERAQKGLEDDIEQATYELSVSNQRLQKALNERSTFIGQMSHEVRTPLNAVMGLSEILLSTDLDETQSDYLNTINSAAGSLVVLLNDMLDITKMEAGKLEIHLEPVLAHRAHQSVVSMFEIEAKNKGLELKLFIAPDVPEIVIIDKGRYKQILTNLISNAIKNTELGFINVSVSYVVGAYAEGVGGLIVQIVDTGIGIPESQVKRIFNAYEQLGISSKGVGLGLAICKELCELMHGEIKCDSEVGKGSTFELNIPAESAANAGITHTGKSFQGAESGKSLSILVAEDNIINQKVLTAQLAQLGQKATIVNNGAQAIEQLNQKQYDVVFMDILMPVMDGEEALKVIRSSKPHIAEHYVVALTASSYQDQKQRLLAKGFDAFLSKPLSIADLDIALKQVLQLNVSISEAEATAPSALCIEGAAEQNEFDLTYLRSQFGDICEPVFVDVAPTYLEHSREEMDHLNGAITSNDVGAIAKHSHSIKGGSASMGLHDIAEILERLEHHPESVKIQEWFDEVQALWVTAEQQISQTLRRLDAGS